MFWSLHPPIGKLEVVFVVALLLLLPSIATGQRAPTLLEQLQDQRYLDLLKSREFNLLQRVKDDIQKGSAIAQEAIEKLTKALELDCIDPDLKVGLDQVAFDATRQIREKIALVDAASTSAITASQPTSYESQIKGVGDTLRADWNTIVRLSQALAVKPICHEPPWTSPTGRVRGPPPELKPVPPLEQSAEECFTETAKAQLSIARQSLSDIEYTIYTLELADRKLTDYIEIDQGHIKELQDRYDDYGENDDRSGADPKMPKDQIVTLLADWKRELENDQHDFEVNTANREQYERYRQDAQSQIDRLEQLPECKKVSLPAPPPPYEKMTGEKPAHGTSTKKTHDQKRGRKNAKRSAGTRPGSAQTGNGISPETARAIGTIIDIGVGVGLSRVGRHHGGDRSDEPERRTPRSVPRD